MGSALNVRSVWLAPGGTLALAPLACGFRAFFFSRPVTPLPSGPSPSMNQPATKIFLEVVIWREVIAMGTILEYGEPLLNGPSPQLIVLVRQGGPGRPPAQKVPGRPSEVKKQKERAKKLVAGAPGIGIPLVGAHTGSPVKCHPRWLGWSQPRVTPLGRGVGWVGPAVSPPPGGPQK